MDLQVFINVGAGLCLFACYFWLRGLDKKVTQLTLATATTFRAVDIKFREATEPRAD